jgi:hypothetical protein
MKPPRTTTTAATARTRGRRDDGIGDLKGPLLAAGQVMPE